MEELPTGPHDGHRGGFDMRRWTTIVAFIALTSVMASCGGGGGGSASAAPPSVTGSIPAAPSEGASASAGGSAAASSAACNPPRQDGVKLTFASFGGVYQDAQRKAWLDPYSAATGVEFTNDENSSNATIKAQVEAGQVTWDVVDVGNDFGLDANKDLLEP